MTFKTQWRALAACLAAVVATLAVPAGAGARMSKPELKLVKRINAMRAASGLPRLKPTGSLARAAEDHSADMGRNSFFAHNSSNGTDPYRRLRGYVRKSAMGETLAFMPVGGNTHPGHILRLWMRSPGHRATLTTRRFRRIGVGRTHGYLNGQKVVFWTADLTSAR